MFTKLIAIYLTGKCFDKYFQYYIRRLTLLFNSIHFLLFFPIVVLFYFILPHRFRWIWLLFASYYFYMSWNPKYALLMATSTVITYLSGLLIARSNKTEDGRKRNFQRKLWVVLSFSSNLAILFFFKYFNFAVINVNRILSYIGIQAIQPEFDVLLPVGISFYTFQALGYTMDVFRGEIYAEKNLAKYALFVSFFPQLVAGPIERSKNLLVQINERHYFDYDRIKNGLLLMVWGYFQKVVVADNVSTIVNAVYNDYINYSGSQILIATMLFAVQIYCDFSGYSDIAKGAAQVMGFRLMDNFHQPYFATSIQDFWHRWHISLSTWFKDYLYIPLGGSRCSRLKKYRNVMITFLVSGLWHGASWNFIVWGGLHGSYQIIGDFIKPYKEKFYQKLKINTEPFSFKLGQIVTTFILVNFAWIFFRAPGAGAALSIIHQMFFDLNLGFLLNSSSFLMGLSSRRFLAVIVAILILLVGNLLQTKINVREALAKQNMIARWGCYYLFIAVILFFSMNESGYEASQFIYFQF